MLSIGKITRGQHGYYERQVARGEDDYYSGRGEAPGEWVGTGARSLGLAGRVTAEQFNALIEGRDPQRPEARLRSTPGDPKVAAFDLTFSAPKSVSVLFAVAPENISGELAAYHEDAVRTALRYLEDTAVRVRRGHGGERVERAQGLIAASYRHRMSRALDPQLHTHVVAANLACGRDVRFTALDSRELYRAAQTAGYLYQAHLRALVSERMGLEWAGVHKGAAELKGVPREVIEFFSKRREEMRRAAAEQGLALGSRAAAELAALVTRERKQYGVQTQTWREETRASAAGQGLGGSEIQRLLRAGEERVRSGDTERPLADEQALGDRLAGPEGLTEHANTFDERAVLREFAAAATQGVRAGAVRAMTASFVARSDILATGRGEMSTAELVGVERRLIAAVVGRARESCCVLESELAEQTIAKAALPLTGEQAQAVREVTGSGAGVSVIEALAGTGKTYTAGVLREAYEAAGKRVLGVAPTGRAVRELAEEAGIPTRTLDGLLADLQREEAGLPRGAVVIFDEAGMAATRTSARLLEEAQAAGVKVVAIGDPGQLASVQAGGWLAAVGRELGAIRLSEVMRQNDPAERRALAALHAGHPRRYLQWAMSEDCIEITKNAQTAQKQALRHWQSARTPVGVAQTVMIARDNNLRDALNQGAREQLRAEGALGEEHDYAGVKLAVGDRVICRRNDRLIDVDNGTRGTVRHTDGEQVTITTDSGMTRELPAAYVAEHVEHAYALTGHGMQGATVQTALVVASPRDLSAGWSYTALSRARKETWLVLYDEQPTAERAEYAPTDHNHPPAPPGLLARVERRMSERDSEDLAIHQLPTPNPGSAGRIADPTLTSTQALHHEPHQEHAATRAEPDPPQQPASTQRLRDLQQQIHQLEAQHETLTTPQGDPEETRAERDSLHTALTRLTQEHTTVREELIEQELQNPSPWVTQALGERPQKPRQQQAWEKAIHHATTYRVTHNITDPNDPLGSQPQDRQQRRDWQRAQNAIENAQQRLHRTLSHDLGVG
ncbi:MAG TPA: MobF family relaxase [Solirubrobacteraceae bacterium]|jgi:conjugative relaxase-like TrwC/TraI family protein